MGGANSRNQEKGVMLQAWVREILKKGQIWNVFITICSTCFNTYAWMYFSFNHNLKVMKNTTYIENCFEFDAVTYILTSTENGTVAYITEKSRFAWRGVFYWASKSAILVEKRGEGFVWNHCAAHNKSVVEPSPPSLTRDLYNLEPSTQWATSWNHTITGLAYSPQKPMGSVETIHKNCCRSTRAS